MCFSKYLEIHTFSLEIHFLYSSFSKHTQRINSFINRCCNVAAANRSASFVSTDFIVLVPAYLTHANLRWQFPANGRFIPANSRQTNRTRLCHVQAYFKISRRKSRTASLLDQASRKMITRRAMSNAISIKFQWLRNARRYNRAGISRWRCRSSSKNERERKRERERERHFSRHQGETRL